MKASMAGTPQQLEGLLLKFVVVDVVATFFIFAAIANISVIFSQLIKFPDVLLLVPALMMLAGVFAVLRFYRYLFTVVRVLGALSYIFEGFGKGKAACQAFFPKPFVLFSHFLKKHASATEDKEFSFAMKSDSQKYKVDCTISISHGFFDLQIEVVDWRGTSHKRNLREKLSTLQKRVPSLVADIRQEVLESQGVKVGAVVEREVYVPSAPQVPVKPAAVAAVVPSQPVAVTKQVAKEKQVEIKAAMPTAKKTEKEALKDLLFEMEEIEKLLKEKK